MRGGTPSHLMKFPGTGQTATMLCRSVSNTGTALPETLARTAAEHFEAKAHFASEFTTVTDVPLAVENERHRFVGVR
jgi:hypothetical protein